MFAETKLLQASLSGDRNAFERIVEEYQSAVCALTFSGTGRLDASEELAQETFVNAWQNLHQLRDLRGFRSWLYSIARNTLRNYHRQKRPAPLEENAPEASTEDAQTPPGILLRKEEHAMLEQAIARLPVKYREPLVMYYRREQSIHASAEALGLNEATFRTRLHRARNLLREDVAGRLEHALERTGPRKDFTKGVMAAISGVPIGLSAMVEAAVSGASGLTGVTDGLSTALSGAGVKVAVVAAVIGLSALVYTQATKDRLAAPGPDRVVAFLAELPISPASAPTDESPSPQAATTAPSQEEADQEGRTAGGAAAVAEQPVEKRDPGPPQTTVTGTVLNKNTLVPISGVRVGFERAQTVVTDSDGRFRLCYGDSQEEVSIIASARGYATEQIALRVEIGGRHEILLKMEPGLTLVGTVVDPNHNPIENAKVYVLLGRRVSYPQVTTDARGQFIMEGLHPESSSVYLHAEHAGYFAEASIPPVSLDRAPLGEEIVWEIILTPGSPNVAPDTHDAPEGPEVVVQDPVGRIYGGVVDADTGRPIPCFRVVMKDRVPLAWAWNGYTFASEQGHFDTGTLNLVPGRQRSLTVHAEGYDPVTLDAAAVQPVSQDPDRIVIRLRANERRSTIYAGRVVDTQGRDIPGAEVGFRLDGLEDSGIGFSRVLTDASGTHMISSIDPCEHIFFIRAPGYASHYGRMSELLLETPSVFADVVLSPPGTISGYVWDEFARGIAHASVACGPVVRSQEEAERTTPLWGVLWPQTQTDEYGHYELSGLPIGDVHVSVRCQDNRRIAPKMVTVHSGESVELNFGERGGFVVSGVVTDGENVLEGVEVQLKAMDEDRKSHNGKTDALGRFKLIHVPGGQYVFATLRPREATDGHAPDPNDLSHVLYEVMDIQADIDLAADYRTRSIGR